MRRFSLMEGEKTLSEHNVALSFEGKARLARLVLTTDRLVVAMTRRKGFGDWVGLVWRHIAPKSLLVVAYEIRRERFASVEPADGGMLVFRDDGEGYGQVSFTLTPDLLAASLEPLHVWQQRLHAWKAGTNEAAPLPTATVIDKP
jgi:hypothetical protein